MLGGRGAATDGSRWGCCSIIFEPGLFLGSWDLEEKVLMVIPTSSHRKAQFRSTGGTNSPVHGKQGGVGGRERAWGGPTVVAKVW